MGDREMLCSALLRTLRGEKMEGMLQGEAICPFLFRQGGPFK